MVFLLKIVIKDCLNIVFFDTITIAVSPTITIAVSQTHITRIRSLRSDTYRPSKVN